jgi:hypothetical protein
VTIALRAQDFVTAEPTLRPVTLLEIEGAVGHATIMELTHDIGPARFPASSPWTHYLMRRSGDTFWLAFGETRLPREASFGPGLHAHRDLVDLSSFRWTEMDWDMSRLRTTAVGDIRCRRLPRGLRRPPLLRGSWQDYAFASLRTGRQQAA